MKLLPAESVRLLSSSQVITSVTTVVKELLENSLDAEASSIDVKLDNYGLDRIEVRDNGKGIKAADTPVMAVRHFTSKICSHDDLKHLVTYGFRGEALGSICAVAEVSITTKTEDDDISTQYTLNSSGNVVSQKPTHLSQGTTVSVLKLFKNIPVRRQFYSSMKKCKEELKKVQDVLMSYAIIQPALRITLTHNKVVVWQKARLEDHRGALVAVLGPSAVAGLLPCHHHQQQPEITLEGFLPKPRADHCSTSSSLPDRTFLFVNKRPVHQKEILKVLRQHYSAQYPHEASRNRYPIVLLNITVPPSAVDVNLTPDKTQVLLHNKEAILAAAEVLLVSLYGYRPRSTSPLPSHETSPTPSASSAADASLPDKHASVQRDEIPGGGVLTDAPERSDAALSPAAIVDVSPHCQNSNCSSSSSVAEDWIVNQIPVSQSPWRPDPRPAEDASTDQLSVECWSRGTALTDPASGEHLQPVVIHQFDSDTIRNQSSTSKTMFGSITETQTPLINTCTVRPLTPTTLLDQEARADQAKKIEEKRHASKAASTECLKLKSAITPKGQKRKALTSNQQLLDQLFSAQPQKKVTSPSPKASQPLSCSVSAVRLQLQRLSSRRRTESPGLRLVNRLTSQSAWVVLCGHKLMVLNPFRVEESLLFQRLLETHILPAASLQTPIQLTHGSFDGGEYIEALCNMEKQKYDLSGQTVISDPRLVANGFKITFRPAERSPEVTAMADCVPFLGVEDLREILTAVVHRRASSVQESRPLKVINYLQGEAVRLARQLPAHLSRKDVEEILQRMERQLGDSNKTCFHGRPFLQLLCEIPRTEQEAKVLLRSSPLS